MERHGVPPRAYPLLAALRGDPSDNLPGVPGRGGEDRGQAREHLRRPRRHLRPPRRADAEAAPEPGRARGPGAAQRRGHPAGARRAARRRRRRPRPGRVGRRRGEAGVRRAASCARRGSALAPILGGDGRGGAAAVPPAARAPPTVDLGRGDRGVGPGRRRGGRRRASAPRPRPRRPWRWHRCGPATPGAARWWGWPSAPPLAAGWRRRAAEGRRRRPPVVARRGAARPTRRCSAPSATVVGPGGAAAGGPRVEGAHADASCRPGSTSPSLALDTAVVAYLLDPSSGRYRLEDVVRGAARAWPSTPRSRRARPASSPSTGPAEVEVSTLAARNAVALGLLVRAHARRARAGRARAPARRRRAAAGAGPGPHGGGRASRVDPAELRRIADGLDRRVRPLEAEIHELRRRDVQRQLDAPAAHRALRRARAHPGPEDQDRASPPTPDAREAARPAPDHRRPAPLPRGGEAALHLRRDACWPRWPPTGASTPPSARRWPAPGGCRRTGPTCTTSRCAPRRAGSFREAFVPADGLPPAGGRLRPGRAARSSPTCPSDPGLDRRLRRRGATSTAPWPPRVFGVAPEDGDPRPAQSRPRWSPTAWPTAWRPTASPSAWRSSRREAAADPRRATSAPSRSVQAYMDRTVVEARSRGYTETLFGRRRPAARPALVQLPAAPGGRAPGHERRHPGPGRRPLQGGPGPARRATSRRSSCRRGLVLQVHDEVLVEVPAEEEAVAGDLDRGGR